MEKKHGSALFISFLLVTTVVGAIVSLKLVTLQADLPNFTMVLAVAVGLLTVVLKDKLLPQKGWVNLLLGVIMATDIMLWIDVVVMVMGLTLKHAAQ